MWGSESWEEAADLGAPGNLPIVGGYAALCYETSVSLVILKLQCSNTVVIEKSDCSQSE